ncbi:methyl-accepting chemotaxis protein [Comamonas guangdongensis]|uniref:Methyl-accepting chemotaxis protein n=1 Tax=Comamonas guangdongensis TaxID=510515 RepID=A0ABV3ZW66_9BURK
MKNMNIGTRVGGGFAIILLLTALMTVFGLWRLGAVAQATNDMTRQPLAVERMISDWYRYVYTGSRRTTAIVKSSDPSLGEFFAADAAASTRESGELQKRIEPLLERADEKALWAEIMLARKAYLSSRDQAVKAKLDGQVEEAERLLNQAYLPATDHYIALIQRLLDMQRTSIDNTAQQIAATYVQSRSGLIVLGGLVLALGAVCAWWLTRGITRPLAQAVQVARTVAANDLTSRPEARSHDETGQLLSALDEMNASLSSVVARVRSGAESIATASGQIDAGNQDLSSRTEEQASSLQQTAASMEQLTSIVRQNADNARQASQLASTASQTAAEGGQVVGGVVGTMDAINASSRRIADIIGVIDSIAFQTNILALNAAVEAARAGEQGRGFAVVASEVRALAQRSATAAKDIKGLIDDSVAKVEEGSSQVAEAGRTMDAIVQSVRRVSDLVAEISVASQEQSAGINQVNQAISMMDQVTQQNAALVEQAAAAAGSLKAQAGDLAAAVSVFRINGGATLRPAVAAPRVAQAAAARPGAVRQPVRAAAAPQVALAPAKAAPATKDAEGDWENF